MVNANVYSERYVTPEMNLIFSPEYKIGLERRLWISVMKAQREFGLDIDSEDIEKYERAINDIDLDEIARIELKNKHDVKARIQHYVKVAGAKGVIHEGMTSRGLTDNVEQVQNRDAARIIWAKSVSSLRHFGEAMVQCRDMTMTARTHHQPAQPTTVGKRFATLAEELMLYIGRFQDFIRDYPMRGIKGAVGTQIDMMTLLKDERKVDELERRVMQEFGFENTFISIGQVYPRSLDYDFISHLVNLSAPLRNFALMVRLMAGYELMTEGFSKHQSGSSAMPHKMNVRTAERVYGLANLMRMYAMGASLLSGDQWEEGDVSCSVPRRLILSDSCYAMDAMFESGLTVMNDMGFYPHMIDAEVQRFLPFLGSSRLLMASVEEGLDREDAHKVIKKAMVNSARRLREGEVISPLDKILTDQLYQSVDHTKLISATQVQADDLTGLAHRQTDQVLERVQEYVSKYPEAATYEPRAIR
tara:strand:+ start:637 stop:2058 length:1422 start_codon:yes stop_codon:yes gene_type:complete